MGTNYSQLSAEERVTIYHWHANGKSARFIGEALGRQASTITRELRRNSQPTKQWQGGYDPLRAEALADRRRRWDGRFKLARQPVLCAKVHDLLAMGWSPEQIAARLTQDKDSTSISHESIYRYIYHRSAQKDYWHKLLPRKKHRRGRLGKRGGSSVDLIKHRVSLDKRPAFVAKRKQEGHWETDMILFSRYGQSVLVAQERASRFILLAKPKNRRANRIQRQLAGWFKDMPASLHRSLTLDNGTEFAHHYKLNGPLAMKTYSCDPHSPWQKGGIENMNGRLRRDLPRKTDLATLSHQALRSIAERHNNTPRKCLGFKTPAEVFSAHLLHFKRESTCQPSLA
jgi:transposase, IS30 family